MYRAVKKQRGQLLATVSATALILSMYAIPNAEAADGEKPPLWLELGWQFEGVGRLGDPFVPPFAPAITAAGFASPTNIQRPMGYSYGGEAGLSFTPDGSDWSFSASVRYGRAHGRTKLHQETSPPSSKVYAAFFRSGVRLGYFSQAIPPKAKRLEDSSASNSETHAIIDFQAGKDVGLGIGTQSTSQLNFGIRFAQFQSRSALNVSADPDFQFIVHHTQYPVGGGTFYRIQPTQNFHHDGIVGDAERSFKGLGPSISWNASAALAGNANDGELGLDWGVNAALLFGQQKSRVQYKTSSKHFDMAHFYGTPGVYTTHGPTTRSKRVTVPDAGGFAGISFRYSDAKLSLGYRADFFLNAIDGGIDTQHNVTHSFYGPFASISIGVGGSSD